MDSFKLPIHYINSKTKVDENLLRDLELLPTIKYISNDSENTGTSENNKSNIEIDGVYKTFLNSKGDYSTKLLPLWAKYYTVDINYIEDTQKLLSNDIPTTVSNEKFEAIWKDINAETGFYSKYRYLENTWPMAKQLNSNAIFLRFLSLYNITSPVLSLAIPVLFMILPFFIIKLQGYPITISKYREVLAIVFRKHQIGQLFRLGTSDWNQRIYILVSLAFYVFQTYQNFMTCISVYKQTSIINNNLKVTKEYLKHTLTCMNKLELSCSELESYSPFIKVMCSHRERLLKYYTMLESENYGLTTVVRTTCMGNFLKLFEELYNDDTLYKSIDYSMYFHSYLDNIGTIHKHINNKTISLCTFSKKTCKFKRAYYPPYHKGTVSNTYNLKKHLLITGPNAAGKTTILKTTILNLLISQQFGCGFYKSASIYPYNYIHSYLNIPDTSGRDSLFQAEARRCVNILHTIKDSQKIDNDGTVKSTRHFCVFDELYSGTNPYEAIGAAVSFLKYLNQYKNVTFMITTHFLDICKKLDKVSNISNHNMKVKQIENDLIYTYKLDKGISKVKGAVKVLVDLNYPSEIIENTRKVISTLNI